MALKPPVPISHMYVLCHIIIHTMSHHHTYYVTSSYILCHIIIHTMSHHHTYYVTSSCDVHHKARNTHTGTDTDTDTHRHRHKYTHTHTQTHTHTLTTSRHCRPGRHVGDVHTHTYIYACIMYMYEYYVTSSRSMPSFLCHIIIHTMYEYYSRAKPG